LHVLIVGPAADASELAGELERSGLAVELRDDAPRALDGPSEIEEMARDLRELESALRGGNVHAVIIASTSGAALAAALVATKDGRPVARLEALGRSVGEDSNARLIRLLADTTLPCEPAAIVEWAGAGYPAGA
jgi:uroporphyrinogen-III synthase